MPNKSLTAKELERQRTDEQIETAARTPVDERDGPITDVAKFMRIKKRTRELEKERKAK